MEQKQTKQEEDDLSLKNLNEFYGTTQYHILDFFGIKFKLTDGVVYIMKNGYSWFITDFLSVEVCKKLSEKEGFIAVKLKLNEKDKGKTCKMIVTDGNENILYKQKYEWTNAKRDLTLFFVDSVLMLSGEY